MKFPRKIRSGAFEAKMYRVNNRNRSVYQVRYYDHDRVEQRITRSTPTAAEETWKDAVFAMSQGKTESVVVSDVDRLVFERATKALVKVDVPHYWNGVYTSPVSPQGNQSCDFSQS